MSRIGNLPISIPSGVDISTENDCVKVKGPKGELFQVLSESISLDISDAEVVVRPTTETRSSKAIQGGCTLYSYPDGSSCWPSWFMISGPDEDGAESAFPLVCLRTN